MTRPASPEARSRATLPAASEVRTAYRHGFGSSPSAGQRSVTGADAAFERPDRHSELRDLLRALERSEGSRSPRHVRARSGLRLDELLGEPTMTEAGPLYRKRVRLDAAHRHGAVRVSGALVTDPAVLARVALTPEFAAIDLSRLLVLDTETTGLAGGTGTVPFLVGLARFEGGSLELEQLVVPNFGAERPVLQYLAAALARASCIVTYNGKSFDWPLLRTRFIMNRVACPELRPHVDLLHCARRIFKPRLPTLRLIELERSVLGFQRVDDLSGAEIPERYLRFARSGDAEELRPILEHNAHDLIALPAVLVRLCAHFGELAPEDDARDQLAYARLALRVGDLVRASEFSRSAARCAARSAVQSDAWAVCALAAQRAGDPSLARDHLLRALEAAPSALGSAQLHLRLTRLCERELKDLHAAREHAHHTALAEGQHARDCRIARLSRRLERSATAIRKTVPSLGMA